MAQQHRLLNRLLHSADERTRRLLAAFLAYQKGRGGISRVADIIGLSRTAIRRGWRELQHPPTLSVEFVRPVAAADPFSTGAG